MTFLGPPILLVTKEAPQIMNSEASNELANKKSKQQMRKTTHRVLFIILLDSSLFTMA